MTRIRFVAIAVTFALLAGCGHGLREGRIVFQSNRDGNFEIYTMNSDGGSQRRITDSPSNDITPRWSPDGSTILFASDRSGEWDIYTVDSSGSGLKQLTKGQGTNTAPCWAFNGTKILFVSTRDAINGDLYLMNADGEDTRRITTDSLVKDSPVMNDDGTAIFMCVNEHEHRMIAVLSLVDRKVHLLTPLRGNSLSPALSPDGHRLAFTTDRDGLFRVYTMAVDGSGQAPLTSGKTAEITPAWTSSPEEMLLSRGGGICLRSLVDGKERMISYKGDSAPDWHDR